MAADNIMSPASIPPLLHQIPQGNSLPTSSSLLPSSSAPFSLQQPLPTATLPASESPLLSGSNPSMVSVTSVTGSTVGIGNSQFGESQQNSKGLQQSQHPGLIGQTSNLTGQHVGLQNMQQQNNPTGQFHPGNLSQAQALGQNQQTTVQAAALNQVNFQQTPTASHQNLGQKQANMTRSQHSQYAQNLQNSQFTSGSMQTQQGMSQTASPAMVQSPTSTHSIPRSSSAQRLLQMSQPGIRGTNQPLSGSLSMPSTGGTTSQQQMLMSQRAAQGQGVASSQQRTLQAGQLSQQNQHHSTLQSAQMVTTQSPSLHQQFSSSGMMGSSSIRPLYGQSEQSFGTQYPYHFQQSQQLGGLPRAGMAGQVSAHPSMLTVQPSQQLPGLQSQFSPPQMQARQKQGQAQASQFQTSGVSGQSMQGSQAIGMMGSPSVGGQLVRPSGSFSQQRMQQASSRPLQQQQQQSLSQQPSRSSPQKLQAQQLPRLSSVGSQIPGSQPVATPASLLHQQQQQPWLQKQMHQQPLSSSLQHPIQLQQLQAQQRQVTTQQPQPQQQQLPQPQHQTLHPQLQQLPRAQHSTVQRPPTPSGINAVTGAPSAPAGISSQPSESGTRILGKRSIQELVAQVDPNERLDPEVEDVLLDIADDFIESVTTFSCRLAKHRKSNVLEAKDVLLHLSKNWDITIPGFGADELRTYKRPFVNETHKQRIALIRKSAAVQKTGQDTGASKGSGGPPAINIAVSDAPSGVRIKHLGVVEGLCNISEV